MRLSVVALLVALVALSVSAISAVDTWSSIQELKVAQEAFELRSVAPGTAAARASVPEGTRVARSQPPAVRDTPPRDRSAPEPRAPVARDRAGSEPRSGLDPKALRKRDEVLSRFRDRAGHGRINALEELIDYARARDPKALEAVYQALEDSDPRVREQAVALAGELGDAALLPYLEPLMRDPSADVRAELAESFEEMPLSEAGPLLAAMLSDPDPEVVDEAIESIVTRNYRAALVDLNRLLDGTDLDIVTEAGEALREMGDDRGADEALARVAQGLESLEVRERREAIDRIREIGGEAARRYLERASRDTNAAVRRDAAKGLEELGR